MLTKDRLATAARECGLPDIALRAERGEFDVLERSDDKALRHLIETLSALAFTSRGARRLLRRAKKGEFCNTKAEIEKWIGDHPNHPGVVNSC